MKANDMLLARKKLAFAIAEAIEHEFPDILDHGHHSYDTDRAAKLIDRMLPSTRDESIAEYDEMVSDNDESRPKGPSMLAELRRAVSATPGMSLKTVIDAATARVNQLRNAVTLIIRLSRRIDREDDVRKKALDWLVRENLMPSPLRGKSKTP